MELRGDQMIACEEVVCFQDNLAAEWYILVGGCAGTACVLVFAVFSKIRAKLKPTAIFSVLIASGDAFTDIAFTVQQLRGMSSSFQYVTASLLLIFLIVPTAVSAYQILHALRSPFLDLQRLQDLAAYYAFVLLIALTNMEVLRVLPWLETSATFDGLPDKKLMVRVWLTVMFLEDIPQFGIQLVLTASSGDGGLLAPMSLSFTMVAVVWRGLRLPACEKPGSAMRILP